MVNAIWKGIKWFFNVGDGSPRKIMRRHSYSMQTKHMDNGSVIKVEGPPKTNLEEIMETYCAMAKRNVGRGGKEIDTIENAKKEVWFSEGNFSQIHKEHLLGLCGIQKGNDGPHGKEYDPRLLQLINLTLNAQGSMFHEAMSKSFSSNLAGK